MNPLGGFYPHAFRLKTFADRGVSVECDVLNTAMAPLRMAKVLEINDECLTSVTRSLITRALEICFNVGAH